MSSNSENNRIQVLLGQLGLTDEEALVFMALQDGPKTHLTVHRLTGISRTSTYRVIEDLRAKGLVHISVDDRGGKRIAAAAPELLESLLVDQEMALERKRQAYDETMLLLSALRKSDPKNSFKVMTFEGTAGLKQMLWNELKTKGEICMFCADDTLASAAGVRWAEKYRSFIAERRIHQRALENATARHVLEETKVSDYKDYYTVRYLPKTIMDIQQELTIHDDVVSIYNWNIDNEEIKIGIEIHSPTYAAFMKSIFESYWKAASSPNL
ncbi:MAG TPA: helix-turn-helix domain-containing protein [Candidatus Saccharimonadales bacterium]|nr:helix-turn-helix domain-containing protein [Candidatus Saccharimonadales bacterium]